MPPISRISLRNPLVLGSTSPRRRDMLALLGIPHLVRAASIDETGLPDESPDRYLTRIAQAKLDGVRATAALERTQAVLTADTIVVAGGDLLGKPADAGDAVAMVQRLAGRTHEVSTRFVLAAAAPNAPAAHAQTVTTRVTFRELTAREAREYAATGEGMDKAGGYAIQGRAAAFITRIEGSPTAVVGLPLAELLQALRRLDLW